MSFPKTSWHLYNNMITIQNTQESKCIMMRNTTWENESASSYSELTIKEGYLDTNLVGVEFRGNTANEAYAIVSYDGR